MGEDYYRVLGTSRGASDSELKKAYRKLARELHPDRHPDNPQAEERFKRVNEAWEVLGDSTKRKLYDEFGESAAQFGWDPKKAAMYRQARQGGFGGFGGFGGNGDINLDDLMSMFGGGARPRRGADAQVTLRMSFEESILGKEVTIQVEGNTVNIRVPPGVEDGGRLRLRGRGGAGSQGAPPGDLIAHIRVASHAHIRRDGRNLCVDAPVTLGTALMGGSVVVKTLTGDVKVKVPPGTQPGQRTRIRGRGVPASGRKPAGHLVVTFTLSLPPFSEASEDQRGMIRNLETLYADPPSTMTPDSSEGS